MLFTTTVSLALSTGHFSAGGEEKESVRAETLRENFKESLCVRFYSLLFPIQDGQLPNR